MASVSTAYVSASVNRHSHAAGVSSASLVAFGSATCVALWNVEDFSDKGVYQTLPGHNGRITAVRFLRDESLITADDKGSLKYWTKLDGKWRIRDSVPAHKNAISSLAVHDTLIVSGASDSHVKVWHVSEEHIQQAGTISLSGRYPLSVELTSLPNSSALVLAIGATDRNIQIWTRSDENFVQAAVLSGHEDWVKSLSFRPPDAGSDTLTLASGSQDGTIRLWNIEPRVKPTTPSTNTSDDLLDAFEASLGDLADAEEGGRQISLKRHVITVKGEDSVQQYTVTFDALLVGHEAGVTSLAWRPSASGSHDAQTLLSTSTDSSVILWSPSTVITASKDGSTLWINRQRFGDVGGQRLGGFVGGLWARGGREVLAWGWNGGWRRWLQRPRSSENAIEDWEEVGAVTGHSGPVRGVSWSNDGEYLLSASLDQTTRVHGAITKSDGSGPVWHELARPQVHGYDIIDAVFLSPTRFISIADEKVARVFDAPKEFVTTVSTLGVADLGVDQEARPRAATVPPLGLSNKATVDVSQSSDDAIPIDNERTNRRPFEGELAAVTLWPEIEKVFGHGYESIALAVSNNKRFVATACKATSADHAVVRVYDTAKWQPVGEPLAGHTLTVTRISFSPDDKYILSVSRDRTWRLFQYQSADGGFLPIVADKSHARIIWDCDWAQEGDVFATASRDKTVKIWPLSNLDSQKWTAATTLKLPEAATAVAFSAEDSDGRRRLAVGLENGDILIFSGSKDDPAIWTEDLRLDTQIAHVDQIYRLAWRPGPHREGTKQIASCSEDGTLKVLLIHMGMI